MLPGVPVGTYAVLDGDAVRVGTESFRCAPGPAGWRWYSEIETTVPEPHRRIVDLIVDASWQPVRLRIETDRHSLALVLRDGALEGDRDGRPLMLRWEPGMHVAHPSPAFNAVSARRLAGTSEITVVSIERSTLEARIERQRYELVGSEEVDTPHGAFASTRWRFAAPASAATRGLWTCAELAVRCEGLFELETYEPGSSGPLPLGRLA